MQISKMSCLTAAFLAGLSLVPVLSHAAPEAVRQPRMIVINRSSDLINVLQVSPSNVDSWGDDLLGRLQVIPGGGVIVNFASGAPCQQDIRVIYHNGNEEVRPRVDACSTQEIVLDGSTARPAQRTSQAGR